jgi:hypothetical protein
MGFTCDAPFLSSAAVLEAWMEEPGVGLSVNGKLTLYLLEQRA